MDWLEEGKQENQTEFADWGSEWMFEADELLDIEIYISAMVVIPFAVLLPLLHITMQTAQVHIEWPPAASA